MIGYVHAITPTCLALNRMSRMTPSSLESASVHVLTIEFLTYE